MRGNLAGSAIATASLNCSTSHRVQTKHCVEQSSRAGAMPEWEIEPLDRTHDRSGFCCGQPALDDFFRLFVTQYEKRNLGRSYVALRTGEKRPYGYYTLAPAAVEFQHVPKKTARKLPKHPVSTALLGRLAVDRAAQGRGLGRILLVDALLRCLELSRQLGNFAVEVHAIDSGANCFYEKYGFVSLLDNERHLYLPIATIREGFGQ